MLFNLSDIGQSKKNDQLQSAASTGSCVTGDQFSGTVGNFMKSLQIFLQNKTEHIDFMTAGSLSLHTMIEYIIQADGPCKSIYLSTWAIKEVAARSLVHLKDSGAIGDLYGIFDYRVKTVDSNAFHFADRIFTRTAFVKNHSKVILIEYQDLQYTILTSANFSNNPRIEAGYISTQKERFNFHRNWMTRVLDGEKIY